MRIRAPSPRLDAATGARKSLSPSMDPREARAILARLTRDAERIAGRFALSYRAIEAERPNVRSRYGVCYADGRIRIRLRHAATGRSLKYSSLVNTLCHELAHLRHFNHGPRFKAFYLRLLEFARAEGIYRPGPIAAPLALAAAGTPSRRPGDADGPRRETGPLQLQLF